MKLYLTGNPCSQQRHCYFVEGKRVPFIVDCGYQRCYPGDERPHLTGEQIRASRYLFLTHSHENQSGALPYLLSNGFMGRVVLTTETARQLPFPVDDPIVLEGLSLPYAPVQLPGGLSIAWGRSGHCSGSAWFSMHEDGHTLLFSGDYYDCARVHIADPIVGLRADLAVLDCDYGALSSSNSREEQVNILVRAISDALADGRPVLLPVPKYGRGQGLLTYITERLPEADIFGDPHFLSELNHLDASAMWVQPRALDMLADCFVRPIPEEFVALGVYFVSDPQLDSSYARSLMQRLLLCGGRVIMTGTVEPDSYAALMLHSGKAQLLRYGVHCTQADMLRIASQNDFGRIIAYRSDYAPTQSIYDV
ncbi:MAG: hypothetical protein Q4F18_08335 [Clostridia bacterium]|nr:hypothetical protein [Clostridia bacterium]